jgi:uncharacterized membrane protein (DUF4010 family)
MMELHFNEVYGLAVALGIGLLVGVERERRKQKMREQDGLRAPAGVRTFALVALLGGSAALVDPWVLALAGVGVVGLTIAAYVREPADPGLTTEIAMLLCFVLGALAQPQPALAAAIGAVIALLLVGKARMHRVSRELISERELSDGLLLAAAALVVLPLMPNRTIDPFEVINPWRLWLLVVLVMAIGALGHIALRLVGARWGLAIAGFFAGFVSSTAAVAGFGQRVREQPATLNPAVAAAMLANLASLVLFSGLLTAVAGSFVVELAPALLAAALLLLLGGLFGLRASDDRLQAPPTAEARMFRFGHALTFAVVILLVLVISAALNHWLGARAALAGAMLAAMAELHAAGVSVAQLAAGGQIDAATARWGVIGLLASSALAKTLVAFISGGRPYGIRVGIGLLAMAAGAALVHAGGEAVIGDS